MMLSWEKVLQIIERHRMTYAIIGALIIAMLLTIISMALYVSSGASRLDLSRPGYERVRSDLRQPNSGQEFSANGPMNSGVANDFQKRFTMHRQSLNKLGNYSTGALDDTELQIAPSE